jgi:hypothetical protein
VSDLVHEALLLLEGLLDRAVQDRNREVVEGLGHDEDLLTGKFIDVFVEFLDIAFEQGS